MNNIDKLIEQGAELARKHEEIRDEILNNPDIPQVLKDIISMYNSMEAVKNV